MYSRRSRDQDHIRISQMLPDNTVMSWLPSSDYVIRILQVLELTNRPSGEKKSHELASRLRVGVKEAREEEKDGSN